MSYFFPKDPTQIEPLMFEVDEAFWQNVMRLIKHQRSCQRLFIP